MRVLGFAAAAVGVAAAAVAGLGFVIARRLTAPVTGRAYDLVVRDIVRHADEEAVVLDRTARTTAPGLYNLWLEGGGWVRLGTIVAEDAATVTRIVTAVIPDGSLHRGDRASWSGVYFRDPADAGVAAEEVVVDTPVGPASAWLIPGAGGDGDHWAIHIHGLGSSRAGTLRGVQVASEAGLTSLVVTYRNDGEGPTVGSGRSTLGATETDDVRAALRFALLRGARRITLFGWSMGAAIALQLAADAEFDGVVDRLVLDSPVLDWQATINANCARAGLPSWSGVFARPWLQNRSLARVAGLSSKVPLDEFGWLKRTSERSVPTLILHGVEDESAPFEIARRLGELRPRGARLAAFHATHTLSWNVDPIRWRSVVESCLTGSHDVWVSAPDHA